MRKNVSDENRTFESRGLIANNGHGHFRDIAKMIMATFAINPRDNKSDLFRGHFYEFVQGGSSIQELSGPLCSELTLLVADQINVPRSGL